MSRIFPDVIKTNTMLTAAFCCHKFSKHNTSKPFTFQLTSCTVFHFIYLHLYCSMCLSLGNRDQNMHLRLGILQVDERVNGRWTADENRTTLLPSAVMWLVETW